MTSGFSVRIVIELLNQRWPGISPGGIGADGVMLGAELLTLLKLAGGVLEKPRG